MLEPEKKYYLEDVIELTGISERNIKFWVAEYHLKVIKEGRKNHYSAQTVLLLKLIRDLTESKFFTTKFIQVQVERCKFPQKADISGMEELNEITRKMLQYVLEMNTVVQPETVEEENQPRAIAAETEKETLITEEQPPEQVKETFGAITPEIKEEPETAGKKEKPPRMIVDDFSLETEESDFQPIPANPDDSMGKIIKGLKSPLITLADVPREKKHSFWHQLKKILK